MTFACGVGIALLHVWNRRFIAPVYDVYLNLTAFAAAIGSSWLLGEWVPVGFAALALLCWLWLARRTWRFRRAHRDAVLGQALARE